MTLGGNGTVSGTISTTLAAAITDLTDGTPESVALVSSSGTANDIDYVVVNLDGTNFGVISMLNAAGTDGTIVAAGDIEI